MGYTKNNTKQKNTYVGEEGGGFPLGDLAKKISALSNQRQAQQNLLFGGEGYGGSFQSQDQRGWKADSGKPYPNSKPYGGWGGYGSDNPIQNPPWHPPTPTWPGPGATDAQQSRTKMYQSAGLPSADGGQGALQMPVPDGLPFNREVTSAASTNKDMPNMMTAGAQPGTAAYEARQRVALAPRGPGQSASAPGMIGRDGQKLGAGPSGGDYTPGEYPFRYEDRAQQIKDFMARKGPGAYGEGAQETLLNRLANPYTAADPNIESELRSRFDPKYAGQYEGKTLVRNTGGAESAGGFSPLPGYEWVDQAEADPAKWRKQRGF